MADYVQGQLQQNLNAPFIDSYSALKEQRNDKLLFPFTNRFSDLADLFMDRLHSDALAYKQYNEDRWHPKILATTAGAGANASATFTLAAGAVTTIDYFNPDPPFAGTTEKKAFPVKVNDRIMIKPATGVTAGAYIHAIVTSVTPGSNQFAATPVTLGQSIPEIAVADEIIILYNALADGADLANPMSFTVTSYENSMNQFSYRSRVTDSAMASRTWYTDGSGNKAWEPATITRHQEQALNHRELMWLLGTRISNTTLADAFSSADTPMVTGNGLIPELLDRANIFEYSSITGPTYNWFRNIVQVLDQQGGASHNMFFQGLQLRSAINKLNLNELQGGMITLGNFVADQEKFVSLSFKRLEVDGYHFDMKVLPSFNNLQTLGAAGFTFPKEGMIFPERMVVDIKTGGFVSPIRVRYCTDLNGNDMSMRTTFYDGFETAAQGNGIRELRTKSLGGIELLGANQCAYVREAV